MTVVSTTCLLTMGRVSNPRPLAEPSRLATGTEIKGPGEGVYDSATNTVVGVPITGTVLSDEILRRAQECFNEMLEKRIQLLTLWGYQSLNPFRSTTKWAHGPKVPHHNGWGRD